MLDFSSDLQIRMTADGSHTLYSPLLDEHYHSVNGAIQESMHVFIESGLRRCREMEVNVLEFGFGTGLNALLTALESSRNQQKIRYTALEKYPLPESLYSQFNFTEKSDTEANSLFRAIQDCDWEKENSITPFFSLRKIQTDFVTVDIAGCVDVVYYDAFAPDKQPDVWSEDIFRKIYSVMNKNGIFTTYCAKGSIRRMLRDVGFFVERIPGPPGKREMLRGTKKI